MVRLVEAEGRASVKHCVLVEAVVVGEALKMELLNSASEEEEEEGPM